MRNIPIRCRLSSSQYDTCLSALSSTRGSSAEGIHNIDQKHTILFKNTHCTLSATSLKREVRSLRLEAFSPSTPETASPRSLLQPGETLVSSSLLSSSSSTYSMEDFAEEPAVELKEALAVDLEEDLLADLVDDLEAGSPSPGWLAAAAEVEEVDLFAEPGTQNRLDTESDPTVHPERGLVIRQKRYPLIEIIGSLDSHPSPKIKLGLTVNVREWKRKTQAIKTGGAQPGTTPHISHIHKYQVRG